MTRERIAPSFAPRGLWAAAAAGGGAPVGLVGSTPLVLSEILTADQILAEMKAGSKKEALAELAALVGPVAAGQVESIVRVLADRERLASTAIGDEVAIPHGKLDAIDRLVLGLGRSRGGLDFESVDGRPTRLFFVLLAPESQTGVHLKALARISRLCKETTFRARLLAARSASEMLEVLRLEETKFAGR